MGMKFSSQKVNQLRNCYVCQRCLIGACLDGGVGGEVGDVVVLVFKSL